VSRTRIIFLTAILFAAAAGENVQAATGSLAGHTVSNVGYALSPDGTVSSLHFTLAPAAHNVRVRVSPAAAWRRCSVSGARVTCPLRAPLAALGQLELAV
jgi:hypothetical protein